MKLSQLYLVIAFCWTAQIWCMQKVEQTKTVQDIKKDFGILLKNITTNNPDKSTIVTSFRNLTQQAKSIDISSPTLNPDETNFLTKFTNFATKSDDEIHQKLVQLAAGVEAKRAENASTWCTII